MHCVAITYADDLVILVQGPLSQLAALLDQLRHVISLLEEWTAANGLDVNPEKCEFMAFYPSSTASLELVNLTIELCGTLLEPLSHVR